MGVRRIRTLGDDILRAKSKAVEKIDYRIKMLLRDMAATMYRANGLGLAAPQIGILKRIVIIDVGDGLLRLINPEIIEAKGKHEVIEGCLSIPGKLGKLVRPERVTVKALNDQGREFIITGEGELAKALCHEIDHLDGVLFIDKVTEFV